MDSCIKQALTCAVKIENEQLVIGILTNFHNNKKIKTLSDITELVEHAIYSTAVEENSIIMQTILKWNQVRLFSKVGSKCFQNFYKYFVRLLKYFIRNEFLGTM